MFASCCLLLSQIIGLIAFSKDLTIISYWNHIYSSLNLISMLMLLIGLVGTFLYHFQRIGKFGIVSFVVAFMGTMLIAGDAWFEAFVVPFVANTAPQLVNEVPSGSLIIGALLSFLSFSIGWILVGISCLKARIIPKYISILIICGGIFGFKALTIPYLFVLAIAVGFLGKWIYDNPKINYYENKPSLISKKDNRKPYHK